MSEGTSGNDNTLDESDAALVARLNGAIAEGRYEVGMGDEAKDAPAEDAEAAYSGGFLAAMNAFRAAKESGDPKAVAEAERHLQEVTRSDLAEFERGQGRSAIPHQDIHGRW